MSRWSANATVACIVERDGRYLMVEERDKRSGAMVFNQPAGHLEYGESLQEAAVRETLEETGWQVRLTGIVGIALYEVPAAGTTYLRTTFAAQPLEPLANAVIDSDIHAVHWLTFEEIIAVSAKMRSPLALDALRRYRAGTCFPMDLIHTV